MYCKILEISCEYISNDRDSILLKYILSRHYNILLSYFLPKPPTPPSKELAIPGISIIEEDIIETN